MTVAERGQPLTSRERQILELTAQGLEMAEIGRKLFLVMATIRTHRHNAYRKLGARNAAHAIALAGRRGYLDLSPQEDR